MLRRTQKAWSKAPAKVMIMNASGGKEDILIIY